MLKMKLVTVFGFMTVAAATFCSSAHAEWVVAASQDGGKVTDLLDKASVKRVADNKVRYSAKKKVAIDSDKYGHIKEYNCDHEAVCSEHKYIALKTVLEYYDGKKVVGKGDKLVSTVPDSIFWKEISMACDIAQQGTPAKK